MAIEPTSSMVNFKYSMRKYLVDNLVTAEGLELTFDRTLADPYTPKTSNPSLTNWLLVKFNNVRLNTMSTAVLEINCCTRQDNQGIILAGLRDTTVSYLTVDSGPGYTLVPFYRQDTKANIGGIILQNLIESDELLGADDTKYIILTMSCRFASKV